MSLPAPLTPEEATKLLATAATNPEQAAAVGAVITAASQGPATVAPVAAVTAAAVKASTAPKGEKAEAQQEVKDRIEENNKQGRLYLVKKPFLAVGRGLASLLDFIARQWKKFSSWFADTKFGKALIGLVKKCVEACKAAWQKIRGKKSAEVRQLDTNIAAATAASNNIATAPAAHKEEKQQQRSVVFTAPQHPTGEKKPFAEKQSALAEALSGNKNKKR